jgi:hypothetical protein
VGCLGPVHSLSLASPCPGFTLPPLPCPCLLQGKEGAWWVQPSIMTSGARQTPQPEP